MSATSIASILAGQQKQNAAGGVDPRALAKILSANSSGYVSEAIPGMQVRRALDQADTHEQQFQAAPGLGEWAPLGAVLEGIAGNITKQHDDQSIADAYQGYRDAEQSTYDREQQAAQQQAAAQAAAAQQQYVRGRADKQADAAAADTRWQQRHSQIAGDKMALEQFRRANPSEATQMAVAQGQQAMANTQQVMDARVAKAEDARATKTEALAQGEASRDSIVSRLEALASPQNAEAADNASGPIASQFPTLRGRSQAYERQLDAVKSRLTLEGLQKLKRSGVAGVGNTNSDIELIAQDAAEGLDIGNTPEVNNEIIRSIIARLRPPDGGEILQGRDPYASQGAPPAQQGAPKFRILSVD